VQGGQFVRRLLSVVIVLGALGLFAPAAHAQYCGFAGGITRYYASAYTSGQYPTYPNTYGGFYGYPYYGGEYPYPAYGGYYPYSGNFLGGYAFLGAGGYYPYMDYGAFYPLFGDVYWNYPQLDYGYRGRPYVTGYYYGGLLNYGGAGNTPLQAYQPYPVAASNYGISPSLYGGLPALAGGYSPYASALYLPTTFTGGWPFSVLYC
jgi:hypothetical protein